LPAVLLPRLLARASGCLLATLLLTALLLVPLLATLLLLPGTPFQVLPKRAYLRQCAGRLLASAFLPVLGSAALKRLVRIP
jgi:hypothetical protein